MTAATLTAPTYAGPVPGRTLHAFSPGSNVSLCGRIRKTDTPASDRAASQNCVECMDVAAHSNPMGR